MSTKGNEAVMLDPAADLRDHRFACAEHIAGDAAVMSMMLGELLQRARNAVGADPPVFEFEPSVGDWRRRTVIPSATDLLQRRTITVVGFFGRVADVVDASLVGLIETLGEALAEAVLVTPGVLGYSTHLLADERNYANLVVLDRLETIGIWRSNATHQVAAGDVAPSYYAYLRIYNGEATISIEPKIALHAVKYWDYRSTPVWHAVRTLS